MNRDPHRPCRAVASLALWALLAACAPGGGGGAGDHQAAARPEFEVTAFLQDGEREVRRDEVLVIDFSVPLDPLSLGPGSICLVPRRGREPVPLVVSAEGSTLLLRPPEPFGLAAEASYYLVIEGFPSLDAPRDETGRPLARRFRGRFRTSRFYGPDLVPPTLVSAEVREEAPGRGWALRATFSEPLEPASLRAPGSIRVFAEPGGDPVDGQWIYDRRAQALRFSPVAGSRPDAVRVEFTRELTDLAGNPLVDSGPRLLPVPPAGPGAGDAGGEIDEDFTTADHLNPELSTALWNSPRAPGVLLGEPEPVEWLPPGDGAGEEAGIPLSQEKVELTFLLAARELGAPREITALLLATTGVPPAEYEVLTVRVTPTLRAGIDDRGPDLGPPVEVCSRRPWRPVADESGMVLVPLLPSVSHDGATGLLFEVTVGRGTHTTVLRARTCRSEAGAVDGAGGRRALRPCLALRGFSLEPEATSLFYDSGLDAPVWLPPVLSPETMPPGVDLTLQFQGASQVDAENREPADAAAASGFVEDVTALSGYRYLRFRAVFRGASVSGEEAVLDELRVPFRARR